MNKACVFTAIAGDYDPLRAHPYVSGVDWIAYTDRPADLKRTDWDVRSLRAPADLTHPRMQAKWYKVMTHMELSEYERTLWVDGKVELSDSAFISDVLMKVKSLMLFRHPVRDCAYFEAGATREMRKYQDQPITEQIEYYSSVYDHPEHWGLWDTAIIGRVRSAATTLVERRWWNELEQWSYQDQISLPVVLRLLNHKPERIGGNISNHKAFSLHQQEDAE